MTGPRARNANVWTVPPGAPFLPTLARALLDGTLVEGFSAAAAGPLGLATATIFVPTRRAARALAATVAEVAGGPAVLLPRILPLGQLELAETGLAFDEPGGADPFAADLPPAVGEVARRMILTRMILAWAAAVRHAIVAVGPDGTRELDSREDLLVARSAADAWALAGDLATLGDELALEGVAWSAVAPLGTDTFDRYWRITLDFLDIAVTRWPLILADRGEVDRAARQIALADAEVARLAGRDASAGPVIVAGSTGASAAAARLIGAVARHPSGAVVLPGLDTGLDAAGWAAVGRDAAEPAASHPQAGLKHLLGALGVDRAAVRPLGTLDAPRAARARFVGEALRPAETTDAWRGASRAGADLDRALDGVTVIEAADEREEALAAALVLREALEGPGTAVLVTPDRVLGRRVREELARWSVEIDESGGESLGTTPAGALARLVLDCALQDLAPVEVLALLAHPEARFGRPRAEVARLARVLEIAVLRGVLPPRALHDPAGLIARARHLAGGRHAPDALRRVTPADFDALARLVSDVVEALAPLHELPARSPLPAWVAAHADVLDAIAVSPDGDTVLTGTDGNALHALFDALDEAAEPAIAPDCPGYAALFDRWAAETPVRGPDRSHPRVKILGLIEARLLDADLVVLGGLDETVWPPAARTDAFLNRPMRTALGLPPPERRIGETAHDLQMALGQARVVLTRARKRGGAPTVPSRFLQRLAAFGGESWDRCRARGERVLALAAALDRPEAVAPVPRPAPRPDLDLRPTRLSVTRIETLRRDPYAIYAEHVLKLRPAEPIGAPMGPAFYGTGFHGVVSDFVKAHPDGPLPPGAAADLLRRSEAAFADCFADPTFRAFLWPRIARWTEAFAAWESGRRGGKTITEVEAAGALDVPLADGSTFRLTAVADRMELSPAGLVTVVDYKTGVAPSLREVQVGFAPQLTLEAAMVERGAFPALGKHLGVEAALYVKFGTADAVETRALAWKDRGFADVVAEHFKGLVELLNAFRDPATGYVARPFPQFAARYNAYDHLSRVKEWSASGGAGAEDGP